MKRVVTLFALLLSGCGVNSVNNAEVLIVKGEVPPASQNDERVFSTVGLTDKSGRQFCTGTLIANNFVLTAAHCLTSGSASNMKIGFGRNLKTTSGNSYAQVVKIAYHESYTDKLNDIGIVKFNPLTTQTQYRPASLFAGILAEGDKVAIAGYGVTSSGAYDNGTLLQQWTKVRALAGTYSASATEIVLDSNDGVDTCQGDSGGPVYVPVGSGFHVVGVTSWGIGCGKDGHYTDTRFYNNWLSNKMKTM